MKKFIFAIMLAIASASAVSFNPMNFAVAKGND